MFSLLEPSPQRIDRFLAAQRRQPYSYEPVGASRYAEAPAGAFVNHRREPLGQGTGVFASACDALCAWRMFPGGWIHVHPRLAEIKKGVTVATVARCFGVWTVDTCRIVYVLDEPGEPGEIESFGFGYGTLAGHQMSGEERFLVAWDHRDDSVYYDLWSFSWPRRWVARCVAWWIRRLQKRFAVESAAAMRTACLGRLAAGPTGRAR